jgi:hypothetical protein
VLPGQTFDQRHLGLGDLISEDTGDSDASFMDMEHNLDGLSMFFVKDVLENLDDEFLGGVIVIVQQYPIKKGLFELFLCLGDHFMVEFCFPSTHNPITLENDE